MNIFSKLFFFVATIALVVLIAYLGVLTAHTLHTSTNTNTIAFTGEGKVLAKPDIAVTSFSIVTEGPTSKEAQDANSSKSKTVYDFLKKQNIDEKDIKTVSYNISPTYAYPQFGKPRIAGYQVNQTIRVKIRDINRANVVLDGIVTAGVDQVNQLSFEIDNPDALKTEARKQAIADAQKKSHTLADQLGVHIGKLVNFSEDVAGVPVPLYAKEAFGRGGSPEALPEVPTGENEITVNVTLTYQLQ